jgi:hypothetical protein
MTSRAQRFQRSFNAKSSSASAQFEGFLGLFFTFRAASLTGLLKKKETSFREREIWQLPKVSSEARL